MVSNDSHVRNNLCARSARDSAEAQPSTHLAHLVGAKCYNIFLCRYCCPLQPITPNRTSKTERAYLIAIRDRKAPAAMAQSELDELEALVSALGWSVTGKTCQRVANYSPKYLMGAGLAEGLKPRLEALSAGILVVDGDLSPTQERNLEQTTGAKVYTRTGVILEIFARRAATKEGKLQVELAQLEYALPRMIGMWSHFGRTMGGIGGRGGEGETQLEMDRRRARMRIAQLRRELQEVKRNRGEHRKRRSRRAYPVFALVGYTNAGKSSLLNCLTNAGAFEANQLFATLDPLTERLQLPNRQVVLVTDTVGFIRRLPHALVDAFHATLEELTEADVLLHVVDGSDPEAVEKTRTVRQVLAQIGAGATPSILVVNKADCINDDQTTLGLADGEIQTVLVSARTGFGISALHTAMERAIAHQRHRVCLRIPYAEGKVLAEVLAHGEVFARLDTEEAIELDVALHHAMAGKYRRFAASNPAA